MDQKHDIQQEYHRRADEFRLPLRADGWEKLERELASPPARGHRVAYRRWAVAASVLLCIALGIWSFLPKEETRLMSEQLVPERELAGARDTPPVSRKQRVALIAKAGLVEAEPVPRTEPAPPAEPATAQAVQPEPAVASPQSEPSGVGPEPEPRPDLSGGANASERRVRPRHAQGWSFGINGGSGKTVSGLDGRHPGLGDGGSLHDPTKPDPDPDPEEKPDDPFMRMMPQLRSASYDYVHRLPLSFGLSVKKHVTDEFSLESGLTYTYLYSDIKRSGYGGYVGNQHLHYLGIPLKANQTVYRQGSFSVYLSGGFLVEYCVSARKRLMNERMELEMNRWQFAVHAAVGAELRLFRPVSVYLEPGVGYYFDSGNLFPSIRNERPWMFGLQLGLRFSY